VELFQLLRWERQTTTAMATREALLLLLPYWPGFAV
jgi:hypothetical protein